MIGRFNMVKKGLLVVLACLASLFLFNCNIGLGNSVDTTPPNVSITSPEKSAIIKNTFTVKGTSTDETYIKSVSVTLTSLADKTISYGPFKANVDKTAGTWEAVINEFNNGKFKIPDGEYGVTVTAIDSASRTSIAESVYVIDNTSPVVIIKRPGLNDTFGRTIKITGDISDSNSLKALYFTPFRKKADGTLEQLCDTQVYPNISGVGLELIVGKYFSSPEDAGFDATLDTVYKAIYDSATAGTQDVFCVIEVEDSAKEYDPPENNLSAIGSKYNSAGNLSSGYFLYDEIYSKIYGSNGYGLSNNDLVKIMNGSYEDPQKAAEVKEILSDYKLDSTEPSADKVSKFALNPENSPTYSVSGYEVTDNLYSSIFNEAKITVAVSPGRDQISVDADTIRLYLVNADNPSDVRVLYETLENIEKEADPTLKAQLKAQRNAAITEKSDSFRITTSIGKLSIGKKYNIIIEGQDLEGNLVEPENGSYFGFAIQSNNKPPVITILDGSTEDLSVKNAINFHYNGTAETQAESIKLEYLVSAKNEKTGISLGSTTAEKLTATKIDETSYSWSFDLDKDKIADIVNEEIGLYTYTVTIRAINGDDGQITEISRRVYLDTEKPAPRISSIVPQITANSKENNVNGIITVAGNITDNYTLKNTVYNLYIDGQAVDTSKGNFGESTTYSFTVDTTKYENKKDLLIEVVTTDAAGNISDSEKETVYIDQSTDLPVITLSNANEAVDSKGSVNVDTNLFDQTGNNKLLGNITDDDALKSITAEYSSDDGATWTKFYENTNLGKTTASVNIPLQKSTTDKSALAEALYKIRITAYDTKENSTSDNTPAVSTSTEFYIGIDANAPKIAINTQKDAFQSETVTVTGSVTDGNGVKSFVRDGTAITVNENGEWTDTFAAGDTGKTVTYTATDVYGRISTETFSYKVDKEKPEMAITSVDTTKDVYIGTTLSTLKSFAGTATDGTSTNSSGVAKVKYSIDGTTWTDAIGTTQWNANIDFAKVETDNVTVQFKALDNASNESETKSVNIILDKAVPVLDNLAIQGVTAEEGTFYVKSSVIKVTGKVTETNLESITVDGIAVNPDSNGIFTTADKTVSEGSTTCRIVATDKAGQITEKTISVYYDKTAPNAEITSVSPKVIANGKDNNVNGTITLQGTARDDDKVASTVITIATSDAENGTYTDQTSVEGALTQVTNDGMRYNYTIDTTKLTDKNFLKITVTTTDRSGNNGTDTETVYIDQSTDLPTLTFSNVNITGEAKDNLFGMGSWTIYGTASDDDGLTSIVYKLDNSATSESIDAESSTSKSFNYLINENLTGEHSLTFTLKDINGKTAEQVVQFAIDNDSPVIKITEPTSEFVSASTTIKGTATDSNGIEKVEFISLKKDGEEITPNTTPSVAFADGNWSCTVTVKDTDISDSANYVYTFKVTDTYGRTATVSSTYKIDNITPTLGNIKISDGKKSVSSTESSEKWFNQSALTLSGEITETNLDSITMTYNNKTVIVTPVKNFSITESFDFEGEGVISFVIKDKAGNQTPPEQVSLNIDTTAPAITTASFGVADKISKADTTTLTKKVTDETKEETDETTGSGIATYYVGTTSGFKVENNILNADGTTINLSSLPEGTNYLYLRVVDKAGNSTEQLLGSYIKDITAPEVAYSSPSANATVNKTITLTGSVSDANSMDDKVPSLYIKDKDENWETIGTSGTNVVMQGLVFNPVNGGTWEITGIDTTVFTNDAKYDTNSTAAGTQIELQVRFSDEAGNQIGVNGNTITLTADQNADRPVIKLNNVNTDGSTTLRTPELLGSISDDDGTISKLSIQLVKDNAALIDNDENWKEIELTDGNWTYTIPTEGSYSVYFKVVDAEGSTFVTNAANQLEKPYVQYQSNDKVDTAVEFKLDTNPPSITNMQVSYDGGTTYKEVNNNAIFGGTKDSLKFKVSAEDTITDTLTVKMTFNTSPEKTIDMSKQSYTVKDGDTEETKYAYFCDVDASIIPSGSYTITVTAKDDAGQPGQYTRLVIVDNAAPNSDSIQNVKPTSAEELTGEVTVNGIVADEEIGNSGIASMQYTLPPYGTTSEKDANLSWQDITLSSSVWEIVLSNLTEYTSNEAYKNYEDTSNKGIYLLPIWFKVTDNAGNVGYITDKAEIRYNPDADKPRAYITYPVADQSGSDYNYVIAGGTIRITGSAEDNDGIEAVYLQFDMDGDNDFDANDKILLPNDTVEENIVADIPYTTESIEWGVKASGTVSWSYALNVSGIEGLNYAESGKTLGVRVMAVDNDTSGGQLAGTWSSTLHISVNNSVPQFTNLSLKRFNGNTPIAEIAYTPNMYIKSYPDDENGSDWYLCGIISDNDGIQEATATFGNDKRTNGFTAGNTDAIYNIKIPVESSDSTHWKNGVTLTAQDKDETSGPSSISIIINIDNDAPTYAGGSLSIHKDYYGSGVILNNTKNLVQNSNGYFTLAGKVRDEGSGFERLVFYFKRLGNDTDNKDRIYNPITGNRTNIEGEVSIKDDLPVLTVTVDREKENLDAVAEITDYLIYDGINDNIQRGGLVKLGGVYRLISKVDYDSGRVEFTPSCSQDFTEAEFVYGMVVDHTGESRDDEGKIKNDDGDNMLESTIKDGAYDFEWDARIDSSKITDGSIELHCVAFDVAGNSRHEYVTSFVSNNAPRLASVQLGTDLNGNGKDDEFEYDTFKNLKVGNSKEEWYNYNAVWNLDTNSGTDSEPLLWTVKNNLYVIPEFVGGTKPIHYYFDRAVGVGEDINLTKPTKNETTKIKPTKVDDETEIYKFTVDTNNLKNTGEDAPNTYRFTFWDSTEGTKPGVDSQWTILNVQLKQDLEDAVAPTVEIDPLYWNSKDDNSLYQNSRAKGHIDLADDLPKDFEGDKHDKVSGKITFKGTADDDVRLDSLSISFAGFDFGSGAGKEYKVTSFNTGTNTWSIPEKTMDNDGWEFKINKVLDEEGIETNDYAGYFNQQGHKVEWTLSINTSYITNAAAENVSLVVKAVDQTTTLTSNDSTTVDVVPYITDVQTMLWGKKKQNQSVYSRTAKGHYPVASTETITLKGFNLQKSLADTTTTTVGASTLSSGEYAVTVNNVKSLNNLNNNGAYGTTKKPTLEDKYNMQANGDTNNTLTDDIYFDVWEINTSAAQAKSGKIKEPVMHINPSNNMIGFAFANGPAHFSMPNSNANSYTVWQKNFANYNGINFVYGANGYVHSLSTGLDTEPEAGYGGRLQYINSKWGGNGTDNMYNWNTNQTVSLDSVGVPETTYLNGKRATSRLIDTERFDSPSIAVAGNDRVYIAYFDRFNEQIRFVYGTSADAVADNEGQLAGRKAETRIQRQNNSSIVRTNQDIYNDNTGGTYDNHGVFESSNANYSIVAGKEYTDNSTTLTTNTENTAGQYLDIAVIPGTDQDNDVVIFVWYDGTNLKYTYRYGTKDDTDALSTGVPNKWSATKNIFEEGAEIGEYCKVAVDANGGIHIAAYSRSGADLYYAYLSDKDATAKTCLVDSYSQVGKYISIDAAKLSATGNAIPYISYYADGFNGLPKVAYLPEGVNASTDLKDGADNETDLFTSDWEVSLIPTTSSVCEDNMNVAVWKDNGVIKNSVTGTSSSNTTDGTCYGNGTSKFVLGYATEKGVNGYIETAQMK